jgi:hypothetical protein
MQTSDLPARFPIPFANNAGGSYIRTIPSAHVAASGSDAPASLYDGFPPETFTPVSSGGVPPNGKDFNGILNQVTAWARWQAAGAPAYFNSTFSTAVGGYPMGTRLTSISDPTVIWISTAENNTTDPDGGAPANWVRLSPQTKLMYDGSVRSTLSVPYTYTVSFPTPFPNACTSVSILGVNGSGSDRRDNWPQLVSRTASGFSYVIQGTATGGDNTLDGIDWQAWGN